MAISTSERAVATAPPASMSEETILRLALRAEPKPMLWRQRFRDLMDLGVASRFRASDTGGPCPVIVRCPVDPDLLTLRTLATAHRLPDTYLLLDEAVLGKVQSGGCLETARAGGRPGRRVAARAWWQRLMQWLAAHADVSLAIAGLEAGRSTAARSAMIDPVLGQVTAPGTAAVALDLDLSKLVSNDGRWRDRLASEVVPALVRLADNLLCTVDWPTPHHVSHAARFRLLRINLGQAYATTRKMGIDPSTYKGLRRVEEVIATVCELAAAASVSLATERGTCHGHRAAFRGVAEYPLAEPAVRNGQVTSISPFSILPDDGIRPRPFLDLLPVVRVPDCVGWRRPRRPNALDAADLAVLYRLTWAVRRAA